jgi:ribonuclease HI
MDDDLREVVDRELSLLEPKLRRDPDQVRALLHPDFVEYGSSGQVWDRTSVADATADADERIEALDVRARRLGPDAVLLTYRTTTSGRTALRSSTWIRGADGQWLMVFHQGTPAG